MKTILIDNLNNVQIMVYLNDPTTYWVKEINIVFLRVVLDDGDIFKVPFSMTHIPGSLTCEKPCDQLMNETYKVKMQLKNTGQILAKH